jgi:predicted lipid-binding transport protein (Tim44 family)
MPRALPAPAPQSLAGVLHALEQSEGFDEKAFLKGARMAFEMTVHAYAAGEREALKNLVSPVLYEAFKNAIDAREKLGETWDMKILNLLEAHITAARIEPHYVFVTVEFISDQARNIMANGVVKETSATERLTDIWTFRRPVGSHDPNWMLVETRSA